MSDWNKAKKLIQKMFDTGWLANRYGWIMSAGQNCHCVYPLTEDETKFLCKYFKKERD